MGNRGEAGAVNLDMFSIQTIRCATRAKVVEQKALEQIEKGVTSCKGHVGLEIANACVRSVDRVSDKEAEERASVVTLVGKKKKVRRRKRKRVDRWMEIELGSFFNDTGDNGDVEERLMEITRPHGKGGLIVQGMEFRPE
ncbi:F-box protein PP2-B10-like [Lycium ferocissimum]|uniref:F-box protein PP2-B10-like n=1 Tax=Lycium ferocissimum TaxID=112874 RepID=UPI002815F71D|nr:F-box protein PP2-B10-like [Lycium ferocissimum]